MSARGGAVGESHTLHSAARHTSHSDTYTHTQCICSGRRCKDKGRRVFPVTRPLLLFWHGCLRFFHGRDESCIVYIVFTNHRIHVAAWESERSGNSYARRRRGQSLGVQFRHPVSVSCSLYRAPGTRMHGLYRLKAAPPGTGHYPDVIAINGKCWLTAYTDDSAC